MYSVSEEQPFLFMHLHHCLFGTEYGVIGLRLQYVRSAVHWPTDLQIANDS